MIKQKNVMTQTVRLLTVAFWVMVLVCCGKQGSEPEEPTPTPQPGVNTYKQSIEFSAEANTTEVILNDLHVAIDNISNPAQWLQIYKSEYRSGSPGLMIEVAENTTGSARQATVTITAKDKNVVKLDVKQLKKGEEPQTDDTDIDDSHDVVTNKPEY